MPTFTLTDSDLAKVRKALRRMAQRHRGDPKEGHGDAYDRICGLLDEQALDEFGREHMGPGFVADWSSAPMPVGRSDREIRLRVTAPHEEADFDSTLEEILEANDPGDIEEDVAWARQASPGESRRVFGGTGVYQDWTIAEEREEEREASPFSRIEKLRVSPKKSGSRVQTLLLSKAVFTQAAAKEWVKAHHFRSTRVDSQGAYWRFRQESPEKFRKIRTIEFRPGVRATVGWE